MAERAPRTARDRVVEQARRLFSDNGYRATTVAHIQVACGLTAGSGALYKHFASKYDLLVAVAESYAAAPVDWDARPADQRPADQRPADQRPADQRPADLTPGDFASASGDDPSSELRSLGAGLLAGLRARRSLLRLLMRDLDEAPDLLDPLWLRCERGTVDPLVTWIDTAAARGRVRCTDPGASATVLACALLHFATSEALTGRGPSGSLASDFLDSWTRHACDALGVSAAASIGHRHVAPADRPQGIRHGT